MKKDCVQYQLVQKKKDINKLNNVGANPRIAYIGLGITIAVFILGYFFPYSIFNYEENTMGLLLVAIGGLAFMMNLLGDFALGLLLFALIVVTPIIDPSSMPIKQADVIADLSVLSLSIFLIVHALVRYNKSEIATTQKVINIDTSQMNAIEDKKECPFCNELIDKNVIKCPCCAENLE